MGFPLTAHLRRWVTAGPIMIGSPDWGSLDRQYAVTREGPVLKAFRLSSPRRELTRLMRVLCMPRIPRVPRMPRVPRRPHMRRRPLHGRL